MWQPLSTLPPSNAGALSAYTQQPQQQPPVMTPGGGGTGAPLPNGAASPMAGMQGLHPMFHGGLWGAMGGRRGMFGMGSNLAGAMADPNSYRGAVQAWRGDMPQFDFATLYPNGFDRSTFDPAVFRQQMGDFRQQYMDWKQDRPIRSDF